MTGQPMSDAAVRRAARWVAVSMGGALAAAFWWSGVSVASAGEASNVAVGVASDVPAPTVATAASTPCQHLAASLASTAEAVRADQLDATDDMAVIAQALIEGCGWTLTDALIGEQR